MVQNATGTTSPEELTELTIERMVPGGLGLAHQAGETFLIRGAIAGERVRVRLTGLRGKVQRGVVVEVLEAAPTRIEPPCPVAGICGGCDFQHMTYEAQLAAKQEMIRDAFRRIGGITLDDDFAVLPSPEPFGYRLRANWHLDPMTGHVGYLAAESHTVVDVEHCPILEPRLDDVLRTTRESIRAGLIASLTYDAAAGDDDANVFGGVGDPLPLWRTVNGVRYRFDAPTFFQANGAMLEILQQEALWLAGQPEIAHTLALDLYSGVGLFSLPLAALFDRVVAIESDENAVRHAKRNARGIDNLAVNRLECARFLRDQRRVAHAAAFAVLDPPRTGLDAETRAGLIAAAIPAITYVSCDPTTLARDLGALLAAGYRIERLVGLDCFPQTHHVEMVVHLRRGAN